MYGKAEEVARVADQYLHDFAQLITAVDGTIDLTKMDIGNGTFSQERLLSRLEDLAKMSSEKKAGLGEARAYLRGEAEKAKIPSKYTRDKFLDYLNGHITTMIKTFAHLDYSLRRFDLEDKELELNESFFYNTLFNLAQNASHAGAKNMWNDYWCDKDSFFIAFADDGCGMTEEVRKNCLKWGFTTKPKGIGTGIGLGYLNQRIKEKGGRVEVSSEVGKGTTITLVQPIHLFYPGEKIGEVKR
jgi:signal transduction histidine kinase